MKKPESFGDSWSCATVWNTIWITEVYRDVANDIYIWRIDTEIRQHVTLSRTKPDLWQSVCLSWYPLSKINATAAWMDISQVRRYWLMTNIMDFLNITQPWWVIIHKWFITEASTIEGMSWWPVFGVNWEVYGIAWAFFPREFIRADWTTKNISNWIIIVNNFLDVIDEHING